MINSLAANLGKFQTMLLKSNSIKDISLTVAVDIHIHIYIYHMSPVYLRLNLKHWSNHRMARNVNAQFVTFTHGHIYSLHYFTGTSLCVYVYIRIHIYMCACMCIYVNVYMYVYMCLCIHLYLNLRHIYLIYVFYRYFKSSHFLRFYVDL